MNKKQNRLGFILLGTYFLVLLHSVVPHFHAESNCVSNDITHVETTHHHHESDHHHHDSEEGILHALGHLFNGFHHLDMGEEHLTHVGTQINNFNNFEAAFLLTPGNFENTFEVATCFFYEHDRKSDSAYSAPPLDHVFDSALPLRAPPVKG